MIDVSQFNKDDLTVKTVDKTLIVEGEHKEKEDSKGSISRSFMRRYVIPSDVKPELIRSFISTDDVLVIRAPKELTNCTENIGKREMPHSITKPEYNFKPFDGAMRNTLWNKDKRRNDLLTSRHYKNEVSKTQQNSKKCVNERIIKINLAED